MLHRLPGQTGGELFPRPSQRDSVAAVSSTNDSLRYYRVHMLSAATDHLAAWSHNDRNILNVTTIRLAFRRPNVSLPLFDAAVFYGLPRDDKCDTVLRAQRVSFVKSRQSYYSRAVATCTTVIMF